MVLPGDTKITAVDLGDPAGFQARIRASNIVAVRPNGYGIDTSMTVFAEDGRVYPFYVRSESIHSPNVPDLVVRIHGGGFQDPVEEEDGEKPSAVLSGGTGPFADSPGAPAGVAQPRAEPEDFVERVEFDPATLHGWDDYRLWGDGDLAPEQVFRDKRFTYLLRRRVGGPRSAAAVRGGGRHRRGGQHAGSGAHLHYRNDGAVDHPEIGVAAFVHRVRPGRRADRAAPPLPCQGRRVI